jgi:hypothetical protein
MMGDDTQAQTDDCCEALKKVASPGDMSDDLLVRFKVGIMNMVEKK